MANLQYIGARYVPKFYLNPDDSSNDWKAGVLYEALTIVTYNNDSYTSKKTVPDTVGDPASNPGYWACTTKYTAELISLQNSVGAIETLLGNDTLTTQASTITGAINELNEKDFYLRNLSQFGKVGSVEPPTNISNQYMECFCYDSKRDKLIIGYYAAGEPTETMLVVVNPSTFAIEGSYSYALTDLSTISYNPNNDTLYLCSGDYTTVYTLNAGNLSSAPSPLVGLDDSLFLVYDSGDDTMVSLKYTGNSLRVNVYNGTYTELLYGTTIDITGFDQTGKNGFAVHNGHIYQAAWYMIAEINIKNRNMALYNCKMMIEEIEDFEFYNGSLHLVSQIVFASNGDLQPVRVYEYFVDGEPSAQEKYIQIRNSPHRDEDLNLFTEQGIYSVTITNAGTFNFPDIQKSGTLIVYNDLDVDSSQLYAHQIFITNTGNKVIYKRDLYVYGGANWTAWRLSPDIQYRQDTVTTDSNGYADTTLSTSSMFVISAVTYTSSNVILQVFASGGTYKIKAINSSDGSALINSSVKILVYYFPIY